jgi:diguanylate cyclase (GGDEF)-like protein
MATARAQDIKLPTQAPETAAPVIPEAAGAPAADPFVPETVVAPSPEAALAPPADGWGTDLLLGLIMTLLILLALAATRILRLTEALRTVHEDELAALGEAREMRRRLEAVAEHREAETAARTAALGKQAEAMARERDELLRTNRLLQGMVRCDTVTGLANGTYFSRQLAKELRRAMRTRRPLSLLVCDIEAFSAFNRTHGHEQGDQLLQQIGGLLGAQFQRAGDLAARLDGDRFAVVMPETPREDADRLAARLVTGVREASIPHGAAAGEHVELSVGIASVTSNKLLHPHQLLAEAAEALAASRRPAPRPARRTRRKTTAKKTTATRKSTTTGKSTGSRKTAAEASSRKAAPAKAAAAKSTPAAAAKMTQPRTAACKDGAATGEASTAGAAGVSGALFPESAAGSS